MLYLPLLFLLGLIKCTNKDLCPDGYIDNIWIVGDQVKERQILIVYIFSLMVLIALFRGFSISVTKWGSAVSRTTIDVGRTAIIWVVFVLIPETKESFSIL